MCLLVLASSCKWSYAICNLLCLASLAWHNIFEVHEACTIYHYFIPFYGGVIVHGGEKIGIYTHTVVYFAFHLSMNIGALSIFWPL